jgi:hypothetical protein
MMSHSVDDTWEVRGKPKLREDPPSNGMGDSGILEPKRSPSGLMAPHGQTVGASPDEGHPSSS